MPSTTRLSGPSLSGERQRALSGNAFNHSATGVSRKWGKAQVGIGNVLNYWAIGVGPQ